MTLVLNPRQVLFYDGANRETTNTMTLNEKKY